MEVEGLNEWDWHPLICTYINSTSHQSIDRNIILSKLDIHRVKENPRTGKNFQAERWGFREQEDDDDDDDALLSSSSFPVRLEPIRDWHRLKKKKNTSSSSSSSLSLSFILAALPFKTNLTWINNVCKTFKRWAGAVVSVLTLYSDDLSSNPAEVYIFYSVNCLKRMKINQKEAGDGPFKKYSISE